MLKLLDLLEVSSNNGSYAADGGEPDTGWTPANRKRRLAKNSSKPEPWFEKGMYTQIWFPTADDAYKSSGKEAPAQQVKVIKKIVDTGVKYKDFYDIVASWDKYGHQDYSIDFESSEN